MRLTERLIRLRRLALLPVLALVSGCAGALQGGVVELPHIHPVTFNVGAIAKDEAGRALEGAECSSEGFGVGQRTNGDGYILLMEIPAGDRILVCSRDGYEAGSTTYTNDHDQNVDVVLKSKHVDPSVFTLEQLAAIRGAMWPQTLGACGNLSIGPRPGQDDNIVATEFFEDYTPAEQDCIIHDIFLARGYTDVFVGPLVDSDGYHGTWTPRDHTTPAGFASWMAVHQKFYDAGLKVITFGSPDNLSLAENQARFTALLSSDLARRYIRIYVPRGWEPDRYGASSCTWAEYGKWAHEVLPNALLLIHTVTDVDAPAGTDSLCNDDDHTWNPGGNAAAWARVVPYFHGWLVQSAAFDCPDCIAPNGKTNFQNFQDQFNPNVRGSYRDRFEHGYAGWPANLSLWGAGRPFLVYAGEYSAYWRFWGHRTEAEGVTWGDAAIAAGAAGYGDSGSLPVQVPVR